ncbi:uncharacterized protein RJT21DRAFT_121826 [Scheffersomyces amazonensis]|uniref:uncharacterized protein n=1 Tax=Scheffersomyces amazonensis TaxID=1078765 RepID=UPI00315CEB42
MFSLKRFFNVAIVSNHIYFLHYSNLFFYRNISPPLQNAFPLYGFSFPINNLGVYSFFLFPFLKFKRQSILWIGLSCTT